MGGKLSALLWLPRRDTTLFGAVYSGLGEVNLIDFFSTLLHTVGRAGIANSTCFGRARLSRALVHPASLSSFSYLEQSGVLIGKGKCYGRMGKVCHVHNVWSLSFSRYVEGCSCRKAADSGSFYWHSAIGLRPAACDTPRAGISLLPVYGRNKFHGGTDSSRA